MLGTHGRGTMISDAPGLTHSLRTGTGNAMQATTGQQALAYVRPFDHILLDEQTVWMSFLYRGGGENESVAMGLVFGTDDGFGATPAIRASANGNYQLYVEGSSTAINLTVPGPSASRTDLIVMQYQALGSNQLRFTAFLNPSDPLHPGTPLVTRTVTLSTMEIAAFRVIYAGPAPSASSSATPRRNQHRRNLPRSHPYSRRHHTPPPRRPHGVAPPPRVNNALRVSPALRRYPCALRHDGFSRASSGSRTTCGITSPALPRTLQSTIPLAGVSSAFTSAVFAPSRFASCTNPAAGYTTLLVPIEMNRSHTRTASSAASSASVGSISPNHTTSGRKSAPLHVRRLRRKLPHRLPRQLHIPPAPRTPPGDDVPMQLHDIP